MKKEIIYISHRSIMYHIFRSRENLIRALEIRNIPLFLEEFINQFDRCNFSDSDSIYGFRGGRGGFRSGFRSNSNSGETDRTSYISNTGIKFFSDIYPDEKVIIEVKNILFTKDVVSKEDFINAVNCVYDNLYKSTDFADENDVEVISNYCTC